MNTLVSIIIPVYNVEKYLKQCIESIIGQSYKNLEIIIIDDGSTDSSGNICDAFAKKDARITVIHQKNQGLSCARNAGIDCATGDWIYFIDSDDWVNQAMIENLLNIAVKNNADISSCSSCDVSEDGRVLKPINDTKKLYVFSKEHIIHGLLDSRKFIRFEVWNKLWNRKLIGDVRFIKGQKDEDVYFDRMLFAKCNKIEYLDLTLHYYRIQRPGNSNSAFNTIRFCVFDEYAKWVDDLKKIGSNNDSVSVIGSIASNTAAGLYYFAKITGQKKEVISFLLQKFNEFYPLVAHTKYCTKKISLFRFNPKVYCLIAKFYKKLHK